MTKQVCKSIARYLPHTLGDWLLIIGTAIAVVSLFVIADHSGVY